MSRWSRIVAILAAGYVLFLASSCHMPEPLLSGERSPMPVDSSTIYVIRHGWHAGIAIRRAHLPNDRLPAMEGVPATRYLELGWGERHYFPADDPGGGTLLRAGLWPTGSVIHAVPVSGSVPDAFPKQTIVRLRIGADDLDRLAAFFRASLEVDSTGRAVPAAPGYYPDSRFFASPLRYHVFQNCNHWAAEALEAAGCSTARWRAITVGRVLEQAARCGERLP
jgi:uncharacterized protein (TIGR02117 family)